MPLLRPDVPYGSPAFSLSDDQIATVLDLICRGAKDARTSVTSGMLEVPITIIVRKAMRRIKKSLGINNLQIRGEHELEDMATSDPRLLGRIDITLQFLHQFGDEDAYVAVECKRVQANDAALNGLYVTKGLDRFSTGQYAMGHELGFMLGYVLALPVNRITDQIDRRTRQIYGQQSALADTDPHPLALATKENTILQGTTHQIRIKHIFVDMLVAA